jgi:hypothetical protein
MVLAGVERVLVASEVLAGRLEKCLLPVTVGFRTKRRPARCPQAVVWLVRGKHRFASGVPAAAVPFGFLKEEPWC